MLIKYIGHSCFYLKSDNGTTILIDPYKPGAYGGALSYSPVNEQADICVLSHDHEDHAYTQGLPNQPLMVRTSAVVKGVDFDTIDTFHDETQGEERGPNRITYFHLDDICICHLGDLGHALNEEQLNELKDVDILIIPVGGTFTIGPSVATEIVNQLKPKITIPMHFKTEKCAFPIEDVEKFLDGKSPIRRSPNAEVMLRKDDLPVTPTILYIPPKN